MRTILNVVFSGEFLLGCAAVLAGVWIGKCF
jgi:hypothetical protein